MIKIYRLLVNDAKITFWGMLLLTILRGIFPAIYVTVYASFIDGIILLIKENVKSDDLFQRIALIVIFTMFQYIINGLFSIFCVYFEAGVDNKEKEKIIEKISKIRFIDMEKSDTYKLINHIEKGMPQKLVVGYTSSLGCLQLAMSVISIASILVKNSFAIALVVLLSFIPVAYVSIKSGKEDYSDLEEYFEHTRRTDCYEKILVSPNGHAERWIFQFQDWMVTKWAKKYDEATNVFYRYKIKSYSRVKKMSLIIKVVFWLVVGILIYDVCVGELTVGVLVILIQQIFAISNRVTWDMYAHLYGISVAKEYYEKYNEFYSIQAYEEGTMMINHASEIVFNKVSFRYDEKMPYVIKDLCLKLEKGKTYAIVGENGAGKSTMAKLLLGIYDEYEGSLCFDGVEARRIKDRRNIICAVFQNFAKYELSIRENVGMANSEKISDETIDKWASLLDLNLKDKEFQNGYDTPIGKLGEKNVEFSGGEWQKVALMRALVLQNEWIVLDEPTSAIDPIAEMKLYKLFCKIMKDRSAILITHRLGAAKMADIILVLHNGSIVESGTHEELIDLDGLYKSMFSLQKGWYQDEE